MKLKIYKTKEIDGEVFATRDVECELNIEDLSISTFALKKLYRIIPKQEFNELMANLGAGNFSAAVISQLYDIFEDKNDDLIYFIRHLIIESGPYVTGEQLKTVKIEEMLQLLLLIFRPYLKAAQQAFKNISKNEAPQNNGQARQQ
jgi:hypothetical protein